MKITLIAKKIRRFNHSMQEIRPGVALAIFYSYTLPNKDELFQSIDYFILKYLVHVSIMFTLRTICEIAF